MEINEIIEQLKTKNCRITGQRKIVIDILLANQQTLLTAEEITKLGKIKNPAINTTTVYRNIELLQSLNLIYSLNVDRHTAAYKLICHHHHHHHIICSNCGHMESIDYCPVSQELQQLIDEKGYVLKSHSLNLYGICHKCQSVIES